LDNPAVGWQQSVFNRRILICVFTGFASGMPLYVLLQLVPAWLRDEGVSLAEIGLFALVGIPYTWKFMWAPLMDRWVPPFLGRRRGWMIVCQIALLFSIGLMGAYQPAQSTWLIAWFAVAVAFFSASQDVVLDAYRREILPDEELGLGNSWSTVFWVTGAFMAVGIVLTLVIDEPDTEVPPVMGLRAAVVAPFAEYLQRKGWRGLLLVLGFMFLYKIGDNMATALATPFYLDMGFTKTQIGLVAKHAALWRAGDVIWLLAAVISFEYLGVGMGTAAFTAFIARETSKVFAATQFALFTALASLPRTFANASTGIIVEQTGWVNFFLLCAVLAIPGMILLTWIAPWRNGELKVQKPE